MGQDRLKFAAYVQSHVDDRFHNRIEFLGPVSREEADGLRKKALVTVCSSRFECFPYAVTEALVQSARLWSPR